MEINYSGNMSGTKHTAAAEVGVHAIGQRPLAAQLKVKQ